MMSGISSVPDHVKETCRVVIHVVVIVVMTVQRQNAKRKSRRPSRVAIKKPFRAPLQLKPTNVKFHAKASWNVVTRAVETAMIVNKEEYTWLVNIPAGVR
jgi:hypothetical protein